MIARVDDIPVGCVAYLPRGEDTVELKRMYVDPCQRGKGIGLMLVEALVAQAKRQNARRMILSSYHTMLSAHRIYRAVGFVDVDAPIGFPKDIVHKVVFKQMDLA